MYNLSALSYSPSKRGGRDTTVIENVPQAETIWWKMRKEQQNLLITTPESHCLLELSVQCKTDSLAQHTIFTCSSSKDRDVVALWAKLQKPVLQGQKTKQS